MAEATATPPAPKQKQKKYVFQVIAGTHWEPGEVEDPDTGKRSIKDIKYGPGRPAGDIVYTDVDLAKRFNKPGLPPKFRRMGEDGIKDEHNAELMAERQRANLATTTLKSALEKMTREALVAWAEEQRLDIKGAVKREDVLRMILQQVA